jgi:hypothetical protein
MMTCGRRSTMRHEDLLRPVRPDLRSHFRFETTRKSNKGTAASDYYRIYRTDCTLDCIHTGIHETSSCRSSIVRSLWKHSE